MECSSNVFKIKKFYLFIKAYATIILVFGLIGLFAALGVGAYFFKKKRDSKKTFVTTAIEPSKLRLILQEWDDTQNSGCERDFDVIRNKIAFK